VELADVEAFLILADELHFGRTAERTYVSPARVSQRIHAIEREIGGSLFERTSRRVTLTPLGAALRDELQPAYERLTAALATARTAARSPAGLIRVGFTSTTAGPPLDQLVVAFEAAQSDSTVTLHEVAIFDPLAPLRAGEIDVLVNWLVLDEPDLTLGPKLAEYSRMLAVAADHPLASEPDVSIEVLGDFPVPNWTLAPSAYAKALVPERTPSGRPVLIHPTPARTFAEGISLVARGQAVHPTMSSMASRVGDRIVLVPINDLPPIALGLIWCTAYENARIRSLAAVAEQVVP
jgi:DNA-binding transcriptional LysR family regulator